MSKRKKPVYWYEAGVLSYYCEVYRVKATSKKAALARLRKDKGSQHDEIYCIGEISVSRKFARRIGRVE